MQAERVPVIAACGEVTDRPSELYHALEPLALMETALRRAEHAAGGAILSDMDSLDVVNLISWPYAAPADALCQRLGIRPARRRYGEVGGETPLRFIHEAAARIARGESRVAAICGGEAHLSAARAARHGVHLPWTPQPTTAAPSVRGQDTANPLAKAVGAHLPVAVYPFYENAAAHALGISPAQALRESGDLWSGMSHVAAANPMAWYDYPFAAEEIITVGPANRMIAHPYRKLMVANIGVNQGAAIILTSLAHARTLGLDDGRLIFVHGSYSAEEPVDYLQRDGFDHCTARDVVLERSRAAHPNGFEHVEIYSCFPCVPKAARRTLGLDQDNRCSVTGGLTFFGAPLNNYMSHAVAAMARQLVEKPGNALLYGQGGFMTKHHALIVGTSPSEQSWIAAPTSLGDVAAARYGKCPRVVADPHGEGVIETHLVIHDRDGRRRGVVMLRLDGGAARTLALVNDDEVGELEQESVFAIGRRGHVSTPSDGIPRWVFAA
ncbi:MAG: acetyl-CoA acetyltransferase [Novosphingobium sp.]